ncbi:MAG: zinc ribbon domain-containing protein [Syntrophomonadaceae bacterium]|nr:zinc ribbon domain-containing protein [Syntrophomonadaceae bacterium]
MPFFDFRCQQCGQQFEKKVSNAEKSSVRCPECGGSDVKQMISSFFTASTSSGAAPPPSCYGGCEGCAQGKPGGNLV